MSDENFEQLEPKYKVTKGEIREDRRQVSSFFTCCWLCGGLVSGVCTDGLIYERFVQRWSDEGLAGEGDVKKGERWFLRA